MLLTLTSTTTPAADLGFLLHKHPARAQSFDVSMGRAHVFYPEATPDRCTAALLVEVDPVGLVRGRRFSGADAASLAQYVNDRPYAASSMLAVALGRVFRTAMNGRCDARPRLVEERLDLEVRLPALPCRGGVEVAEQMFGPLGWDVDASPVPLDPELPEWGNSAYVDLRLSGRQRLADALNHLYVLLPVLDDAKHYWVSTDEVDKLVRAGGGWLQGHPRRELITRRYLAHQRSLVSSAVDRLTEVDDAVSPGLDDAGTDEEAAAPEAPRVSLARQRVQAVLEVLREAEASKVVDLGCGEGALLRELLRDPTFTEVVGVDVSDRALRSAERRLALDRLADKQRERLRLWQSALTYRDQRLAGFDAAVLMEVVEHLDPPRLPALEHTVFAVANPGVVVVTTPNAEHNARFEWLPAGDFRHPDHRFEWTRAQFAGWAHSLADRSGYHVRFLPVGTEDPQVGPPTQMAVFTRNDASRAG
ncbi:MAG TPA: 3' terminal RNA ribose 2'-O-methyltransferase Hen1 [Nocardioidaceae bacterium]|nr:3' terminal RNA ribose 2'-O-methyltransferase Hen1 [Nocardioidaceae bacterium]